MFLIDAGTPVSTGHEENKMGIRTSNTCDVVLGRLQDPGSEPSSVRKERALASQ